MAHEHDEDEENLIETVTLGDLIADLQAIAQEIGPDVPVFITTRQVEEDDFEETWALYDITAGAPDPDKPKEYVVLLNAIGEELAEDE